VNDRKLSPSTDLLIINDDVGFRQERDEAVFDTKRLSDASSVLRASRAPTVKLCARSGQFLHVFYPAWDWHGFGAGRADHCGVSNQSAARSAHSRRVISASRRVDSMANARISPIGSTDRWSRWAKNSNNAANYRAVGRRSGGAHWVGLPLNRRTNMISVRRTFAL